MKKDKETELEQYLKKLDKQTIIGLYLQKTFDDDYIINDLKKQVEGQKELRQMMSEESKTNFLRYTEMCVKNEQLEKQNAKKDTEIKNLDSFIKRQREEVCREIAEGCIKHVELISFGNNHSEFIILASDLNECLNKVVKRR